MTEILIKTGNFLYSCDKKISKIINRFFGCVLGFDTGATIPAAVHEKLNGLLSKNTFLILCAAAVFSAMSASVPGAFGFVPLILLVFIFSFVSPAAGLAMTALFFAIDARADLGQVTVFSTQALLTMNIIGAALNLAVTKVYKNIVYTGITPALLMLLASFIPALYMPQKIVIIKNIIKSSELFIVYFLCVLFIRKKEDFKNILAFLSFTIFIFLAVSVRDFINPAAILPVIEIQKDVFIPRLSGGMGVTALPAWLNMVFPVSLALLLSFKYGKLRGILFFISSSLIFASIIALPFSRAGWIVLVISVLLIIISLITNIIRQNKKKIIITAVFVFGAIISCFMLTVITGDVFSSLKSRTLQTFKTGTVSYSSMQNRLYFLEMGIKMAGDYPFGIGPGNHKNIAYKYRIKKDMDPAYIHHLHNLYIQILVNSGILGLLSLAGFFIYFLYYAVSSWKLIRNPDDKIIIYFFLVSFIAFAAESMFDVFLIFSRGVFLGFVFGSFIGYISEKTNR